MFWRRLAPAVAACAAIITAPPSAPASPPATPVRSSATVDDPALRALLTAAGKPGASGEVDVEFVTSDASAATDAVVTAGGRVTGRVTGLVQARISVDAALDLAGSGTVGYVRAPRAVSLRPVEASIAPTASAGAADPVAVTGMSAWHQAGFTGAGVRVGIIDYFNRARWEEQQLRGDLVPPSGSFCRTTGHDCSIWDPAEVGHGNAVAELLHRLAPDAELFLATAETAADHAAAVEWFAANGVTVVNRSLASIYDGPGDGTGPMDAVVDLAATYGMTWINAAGNEGYQRYWRGPWRDADGDGWGEFAPGDESLDVSGCLTLIGVRWSDWGPPAERTDYDATIEARGYTVAPEGPPPDQRTGAPPIELAGQDLCNATSASIRLRLQDAGSGTDGDVIEVLAFRGIVEHSSTAYSAATPVVDSANRALVAVGAIDPPTSGAVAAYGSQGPTNDGRRKPDLTAPTCFPVGVLSGCLNGTSGASAVTAGIAAVMRGSGVAATPQGVAALLKHLVVDRGPSGPDNGYGTGELHLGAPPTQPDARPAVFRPIAPTRILDTRASGGRPAGRQEPETIVDLRVAGAGTVPAGASAVAVNLTIVDAVTAGYAQVLPSLAGALDAVSTLNVTGPGATVPNFAIVPLGQDGSMSVYLPSGGHVLVDLLGWFAPVEGVAAEGRYLPIAPNRVLDTRQRSLDRPEVLPEGWSDHRPRAGEIVTVPVDRALPTTGAGAVVLTVTATEVARAGFVTAFPTGLPVPDASMLNLTSGSTQANTVIVPLGTDGTVSLYTDGPAHLIADVQGYITGPAATAGTAGRFVPIRPTRLLDSRGHPPIADREVSVPDDITGAALNLTVAPSVTGPGFLQVWGVQRQPAGEFSNLNWTAAGETVAAGGIVAVDAGPGAGLATRSTGLAQLLVDASGYFTGPSGVGP